jgi:FkbM family methyltransferase
LKKDNELISSEYILNLACEIKKFVGGDCRYLEAGAFDGVSQSNTLILNQELGWDGLLIEPIPRYYDQCVKNRPRDRVERALLVSNVGQQNKVIEDRGMMSRILDDAHLSVASWLKASVRTLTVGRWQRGRSVFSVECKTINELCRANGLDQMHFMSIDVEGFEYEALLGANFESLNTIAILVECRPHMIMNTIELLIPKGYILAEAMTRFNCVDNPSWDGTHQDYLFLRRDFFVWLARSN